MSLAANNDTKQLDSKLGGTKQGDTKIEEWAFESFMERNLEKELLRFTTAGSVDDGKSTLIGRLLHDSKGVYEDQLASVRKSRINRSGGPIDFVTVQRPPGSPS